MNKIIMSLALVFLIPLASVAEIPVVSTAVPVAAAPNADQAASKIENKFQALAAQLNLTAEQKAQLKPVFEARREQAKALKLETNPLQRKLAALALMQQASKDVEKVLTPEQMQKFNALKQERMLGKHHTRQEQTPSPQPQVH